jgi:hypothetical protein
MEGENCEKLYMLFRSYMTSFGYFLYIRVKHIRLMTRLTVFITIALLVNFGCKKEEAPPATTGAPKTLTVYEQNFEGDWLHVRTELYDVNGNVYDTIDLPGSPNHPDSIYNGTQMVFVDCDPYWYHYNYSANVCSANASQWQGWYGTLPASNSNMCWNAVTDTLVMSGSKYLVEYVDQDSLVFRQTIPGAGYRLFLEKN